MNVIPVKSVGYYIMLICVFMSCQDKTYEEPIDKSFREIKISVFDESLIKSMPQVELKLDDFQFSLASVNNTTICLELGKHRLTIKDTKSDSIYLARELLVTDNNDLLWIRFDEQPSDMDYQRHFADWKLIDTLIKTEPSNYEPYRQMKLELFIKGQLADSIISEHQRLYDDIINETQRRDIRPKSNQTKQMGFSILYHQTMKL